MEKAGRPRKSAADRFWPKVDRRGEAECWPWIGTLGRQGYGRFYMPDRPRSSDRVRAHRVAYELRYGSIPEGLVVMHRCDNRACCNPAHLRLGTIADNNRDRANKGRGRENRQWGAANPNAKLGEEDVRSVIAALQTGESQTSIAARFGIKQPQVSRIARREQWSHLWEEQ